MQRINRVYFISTANNHDCLNAQILITRLRMLMQIRVFTTGANRGPKQFYLLNIIMSAKLSIVRTLLHIIHIPLRMIKIYSLSVMKCRHRKISTSM